MCEALVRDYQSIARNARNPQVKNIFQILADGQIDICAIRQPVLREVTLVLKNSKPSGGTFIRWMTEDDSKFQSTPNDIHPGEYIISYTDPIKRYNPRIPILIQSQSMAGTFIDYPSFAVPADVADDIAATYFSRQSIERVSGVRVKICFMIEYYMMTSSAERSDLRKFLRHVVEFVRNIDTIKNSVVLVASNVPSALSSNSDAQIINATVRAMQTLKTTLQQPSELNKAGNSKIIELLNMLMYERNRAYPRLDLFRSPDKRGPLSSIPLLIENKEHLRAKLKTLEFVQIFSGNIFGYTITESTRDRISTLIEELHSAIYEDMRIEGRRISEFFEHRIADNTSYRDAYEGLNVAYEGMLEINKSASASGSLKKCLRQISADISKMSFSSLTIFEDYSYSTNSANASEFLHNIIGAHLPGPTLCVNGLAEAIQGVEYLRDWYRLLLSLYDRLTNCNISRIPNTFLITSADVWKLVSNTNLKDFINRNIREMELFLQYEAVKDLQLNQFKVQVAIKILADINTYRNSHWECNTPAWRRSPDSYWPSNCLSFSDIYITKDYLNDLWNLEESFYKLERTNRTYYLPYYYSLLARVRDYDQYRGSLDPQPVNRDYTALHYLQTCLLSRIQNIDGRFDNYVVVDVGGYFKLVGDHILTFRNTTLRNIRIEHHRVEYRQSINTKIQDAFTSLDEIIPDIDRLNESIIREIERLFVVLKELRADSIKQRQELQSQQNWLLAVLGIRVILTTLQVASRGLLIFGPIGEVLVAGVDMVVAIPNYYLDKYEKNQKSIMDKAIERAKTLQSFIPLEKKSLQDHLRPLLSDEMWIKFKDDVDMKALKVKLDDLYVTVVQTDVSYGLVCQKKREAKIQLQQFRSICEMKVQTATTPQAVQSEGQKVNYGEMIKDMFTTAAAGIQTVLGTADLWGESRSAMEQLSQGIDNLDEFRDSLLTTLVPMVDGVTSQMTDVIVRKSLNASKPELARNQMLMRNMLIELRKNVEQMRSIPTSNSPIVPNILSSIDKLENTMNTAFETYRNIQDFQDQINFANYMADVASDRNPDDDPDLAKDIDKLELRIKSNLIMQDVQRALSAFKQYIFPFIGAYTSVFNVTSYLKPPNVTVVISIAYEQINTLRDELVILNVTVGKLQDPIYPKTSFNVRRTDGIAPFFVWRHETHKDKISLLFSLSNKAIYFMADITQAENINLNAIKFNTIGIRFLLPNKTIEEELNRILVANTFKIEMVHRGTSYYRCNYKYYAFDHNVVTITENVVPMDLFDTFSYHGGDATYGIISSQKPIFSPYALWSFKFTIQTGDPEATEISLDLIKKFQNEHIDIALEGSGSYVTFPASSCEADLDSYYKYVGPIAIRSGNKPPVSPTTPTRKPLPSRPPFNPTPKQPFYNYYHYDRNASFATNSANRIKSPMNIAINWLAGTLCYFEPFWTQHETNYNTIKDGFRSIFAHSKSSNAYPTEDQAGVEATSVKFNVFESLTLVDFLIRWWTKIKPYNNGVGESINSIEIRAFVLNLVEQVENLIQFHSPEEPAQLDALALISELENKLTVHRSSTVVKDILYRAVLNADPNLDHTSFNDLIRRKVNEMVPE